LALYRRYRPDTFAEIIGQEHVTEPLQRALANNKVNHAYLFSGPRGCGKTTSARILARALNCAKGPVPVPCGECQSCRDLARGGPGSIDVIEIDAASHGGVDDARELRERAFFAPVSSRYKIYIIDEAHMVTKEGFNALLKVVEEPPEHVKFIFATTAPDKVLPTIRSRTHHYPFRLVPPKVLSAYLAQVCESEGVLVEPAVLPLVVRAGAGSVRDSLSVLDQLLGSADENGVSYVQAAALLGFTEETLLDEVVDAFAAGDAKGVFAAVDKVIEAGQDPRRFAEDLLTRLRDLIIVAAVPTALSDHLVNVAQDQGDRLLVQANALGPGELTRAAEVIANGLTEMRGTTAPRLHLELMCSRVLLPGADVDGRGIHARLDRLERRLSMAPSEESTIALPRIPESRAPEHAPAATPPIPAAPQVADAAPAAPPAAPTPATEMSPAANAPATAPPPPDAPATEPAARQVSAGSAQVPSGQQRSSGDFSTADFRGLWPKVLEEVKSRRRFTWILLSQNAQVSAVEGDVLTLAMSNAGARDSFARPESIDVLKASIVAAIGAELRIETVLDPAAAAPTAPAEAPLPRPEHTPEPPAAAAEARRNIQPTRTPGSPVEVDAAELPSRDDPTLADAPDIDELLKTQLGATLIAENDAENPS
jgi:DNA polymerase-3 subunit gamma/tau